MQPFFFVFVLFIILISKNENVYETGFSTGSKQKLCPIRPETWALMIMTVRATPDR